MNDERIIKIGLAIFACTLITVSFALFAVGEVRGTFHFRLSDELVDLIKWMLGVAAGLGAINGAVSGIVALRAKNENPGVKPDGGT